MGKEIEVTLCNPHGKAAFPVMKVFELLEGELYTYRGKGYYAAISKSAIRLLKDEAGMVVGFEEPDSDWHAVVDWDCGNMTSFDRDTLDEILLHFWKYDNE